MKKVILIILLVPLFGFGQDNMMLFDQDPGDFSIKYKEILCKVLEIDDNNIKYKKFSNINGPTIVIKKSEVYMIKYSNGTSETITVKENDDPLALLIWLNKGKVKSKEDKRTPQELIALLPDCSKKSSDDMEEDALALVKLWQWGYIELPRKNVNLFYTPDPANITALLNYQKKYGLQELPVDIVNGCRIPQETLDHINANEDEIIINEL
jgi:hypothetical protein